MAVKVTIFDPEKTRKRIFDDATMKYAHTRLQALCDPYVPMDSGTLSQTVEITPEYVHYKSPYAHYQWEGKLYVAENGSPWAGRDEAKKPTDRDLDYSTDKHPLATSHWEQAMAVAKGQQLADEISEYLKRK